MTYAFILTCVIVLVLLIIIAAMTVSLREQEKTINEIDADRYKLMDQLAAATAARRPYDRHVLQAGEFSESFERFMVDKELP